MNNVIELKRLREERDALEQRLFQVQKLEATSQLAGGIVHDFNNLLAIVVGQLDLVEEKMAAHPDIQEQVRVCKRAAEQTASLTRGMLTFLREQTLYPVTFDMHEAAGRLLDLMRYGMKGGAPARIVEQPGLWFCEADPIQLQNALLNLVVNARDAMPQGGIVTVALRNAALDADQAARITGARPGEYVVLSVSDTGIGMTPEILEKACQPFFTTKTGGRGNGLGLSMVHGFATRSGGHMRIDSAPGQGTTVELYLPRGLGPVMEVAAFGGVIAPPAPPSEAAAPSRDIMLVVDDNPDMREWVVTLLRKQGYGVFGARDAAEALGILRTKPDIAVMFLDLILPGAFGAPQLVEQVGREMPGVKVVYMSGHSRQSIPKPIRLAPGTRLLEKPFGRDELLLAINDARR